MNQRFCFQRVVAKGKQTKILLVSWFFLSSRLKRIEFKAKPDVVLDILKSGVAFFGVQIYLEDIMFQMKLELRLNCYKLISKF